MSNVSPQQAGPIGVQRTPAARATSGRCRRRSGTCGGGRRGQHSASARCCSSDRGIVTAIATLCAEVTSANPRMPTAVEKLWKR